MKPRTLSASAIGVAEKCLLRYKAEQIDRVPDIDKDAARAGSAVHGALELFVTMVYINKTHQRELKLLIELYGMSFLKTFGYLDHTSEIYVEGVEMLDKWYERDHLANRQVLSCEIKKSFPIKTSIGDIPFNYILDRFDKLSGDRVSTSRICPCYAARIPRCRKDLGRIRHASSRRSGRNCLYKRGQSRDVAIPA
jgi:hypothetical protein